MAAPFAIPFVPEMIVDLHRRLDATRWNDAVTDDWSMGTERGFLESLVRHWRATYDWEARVAQLNRLPHFRMVLDGLSVHFLHFCAEGGRGAPLLLMNGWPSSFIEFQQLGPLLTSGFPAFDVVIPSMPGFGFSDRPTRPYQVELANIYPKLMSRLGYEQFLVAGTDIGAGVATRIALRHPKRVLGVHVSTVAIKPRPASAGAPTPAELEYDERVARWGREEGAYQVLQSTRPQTLAFGLADSPVGLASWIIEKIRGWTDCQGDVLSVWPMETLIDNLMIYWSTQTIGSSVRFYHEAANRRPPLLADDFVEAPTSVAMWCHDLVSAPREVAARLYNVERYTLFARGGHFPAWEVPELYAEDIRLLARVLRP